MSQPSLPRPLRLGAEKIVVGFDPAAGEDSTVAFQRWQEELVAKVSKALGVSPSALTAGSSGPTTAASFGPGSKTYRTGGWMAHPQPFPYGTILHPKPPTPGAWPTNARLMVIGALPSNPGEATLLLRVDDHEGPPEFHGWTNESLVDVWEPET